jgi:hypothetical protein
MGLVGPYIISELVKWFEQGSTDYDVPYKLMAFLAAKQLLEVSIGNYTTLQFHNRGHLSVNILMNYSYQKQLKLTQATNKKFDSGEVISILEHSCHRINSLFGLIH